MAGSLNRVMLIGRVGRDPEIRSTNSGSRVCNFSLATSETWKDKRSGERQEKTDWHQIAVWNEGTVGFIEDYVSKGDMLYVEGQLQTRKWEDKDGNERYTTEVTVKPFSGSVQLLQSKDGGGDRDDRDDRRSSRSDRGGRSERDARGSGRGSRSSDDNRGRSMPQDDLDGDEIPF